MPQRPERNESTFTQQLTKHTRITSFIHTNTAVFLRRFPPRKNFEEATTQRQRLFKPFHTPAQQNIRHTSWLRAEGYPRAFPKLDTFVGKTFSWSPGRLSEAVPTRSRAGFSQMKKPGEAAHAIGPAHPEGPRQRDCHQPSSSCLTRHTSETQDTCVCWETELCLIEKLKLQVSKWTNDFSLKQNHWLNDFSFTS